MITRINISLPEETRNMLRRVAPKRGISRFLVEALEEKIEREKRERALKELLEGPPAFTFLKGKDAAVKWVRKLRAEDERRFKRVWRER